MGGRGKLQFLCLVWLVVSVHTNGLEDGSESEEENCTIIGPKPKSPPEIPIDVLKLFDSGSHPISSDARVGEAVLILGNTGSGKTTLTQIIAGDLTRIHLVHTQGGTPVIVDDENRIGAPSTACKTLVPELVWKKEEGGSMTAFYDCPGFDDTRGPEKDIATNFFMNHVVRSLSRIKLLFVVIHSSVRLGNERLDFDLLVGHATKFLKNVEDYRESIGLVITKVDSYIGGRRKPVSDKKLSRQVEEFLRGYNTTLHSQLESESTLNSKEELVRKIQFVEILLEREDSGRLARVAFSRGPEECGPLSESPIANKTRQDVTQLYSETLEYSQVNWRDFGYTLKDRTKLEMSQYVAPLNNAVERGIAAVTNDFREWHDRKYFNLEKPANQIKVGLTVSAESVRKLVGDLKGLGNSFEPKGFFGRVKEALEQVDYSVASKLEEFFNKRQKYFDFFDQANSARVVRAKDSWMEPVGRLGKELAEYLDWYEFCANLEVEVEKYRRQSDKPKKKGAGGLELVTLLREEGDYPVPARIAELAQRLGPAHVKALEHIVDFWLRPVEVKCHQDKGIKKVSVMGNYVKVSDFVSKYGQISVCGGGAGARHIEVHAAHTIFIDENVEGTGRELNIVMVAPVLEVVGGKRYLNLTGSHGAPHSGAAASGQDRASGDRLNGKDGLAGRPGGSGGSFLGMALEVKGKQFLEVREQGGSGGPGQDGGRGGRGADGIDLLTTNYEVHPAWKTKNIPLSSVTVWTTDGFKGGSGGRGGDGGVAGEGGSPGKKRFILRDFKANPVQTFHFSFTFGGKGGLGGAGGEPSKSAGCSLYKSAFGIEFSRKCAHGPVKLGWGGKGGDGRSGTSTLGKQSAKPAPNTIVEWESILNWKYGVGSSSGGGRSKEFLEFLEGDRTMKGFFGVKGWVDEMRRIFWHKDAARLLPPYIERLEDYARESYGRMEGEKKKVISYLLTTAYGKMLELDQDKGMGMVVDVAEYLKVVQKTMESFKQSSALEVVQDSRGRYEWDLRGKMDMLKGMLDDAVLPAVDRAKLDLGKRMEVFGKELEELIVEAGENVVLLRERLKVAVEKRKEELIFKQVMGAVTGVVGLGSMLGGPIGNLATGFTTTMGLVGDVQGTVSEIEVGMQPGTSTEDKCTAIFGNEITSNLQSKFGGDNVAQLDALVQETEAVLGDAYKRKHILQKNLAPLLQSILGSMEDLASSVGRSTEDASTLMAAQLGLRKWEMVGALKDAKLQLGRMGEGLQTSEFVRAVDRVQDGLEMMMQLVEEMEKYEDARKLASYLGDINSASMKNIQVRDPQLSNAVTRMEKASLVSTFWVEYRRALNAFKQWVFPFAKLHLSKELQRGENGRRGNNTSEIAIAQLEKLQSQLEIYKVSTNGAQDTHLISTNFSSSHKSSSPFYVWRMEDYSQQISDLLAGLPFQVKADAQLSLRGRDGVKFKQIEINLKIPVERESGRETQASLNSELEHFGVMMTHSGLSYYRFQGDFYVMMGVNQTIRYNFERDRATGNRLGTNQIYEKCMKGDYLLSPYTLWTIQLVEGLPSGGERGGQASFRRLERFAPLIDLELVGTGIYVEAGRLREDLEVEKYYERDQSLRKEMLL